MDLKCPIRGLQDKMRSHPAANRAEMIVRIHDNPLYQDVGCQIVFRYDRETWWRVLASNRCSNRHHDHEEEPRFR